MAWVSLEQPGAAGGNIETGQMASVQASQMSQQQSSVLSQQQISVLSQQKTSFLSQQKTSQLPAGGRQLSRLDILFQQKKSVLVFSQQFTLLKPQIRGRAQSFQNGQKWVQNSRQDQRIGSNESHGCSGAFGTGPADRNVAKTAKNHLFGVSRWGYSSLAKCPASL